MRICPALTSQLLYLFAVRLIKWVLHSSKPVILQLTQTEGKLNTGQAKQIWTGNPLPGAAIAIMLENTEKT